MNTWYVEQMREAGVAQQVQTSVLRLLEVWDTMNHTNVSRDETLDVFGKLARGHALVEQPMTVEEVWEPARPGALVMGDRVRVFLNAYDGEAGLVHNGRRGLIVAIRYGDIVVRYDDEHEPKIDGARHSPHMLEKRVR